MVSFCRRCSISCGESPSESANDNHVDNTIDDKKSEDRLICGICLGLFESYFQSDLLSAIEDALEPYGGMHHSSNRFSRKLCPPVLTLPGDVILRFRRAIAVKLEENQLSSEPTPRVSQQPSSPTEFAQTLKQHSKTLLLECLDRLEKQWCSPCDQTVYPPCVDLEELGHLAVHVIIIPKSNVPRPFDTEMLNTNNQKRGRKRKNAFLDGPQQGGDPRQHHDERVKDRSGTILFTVNQALQYDGPSTFPPGFFDIEVDKDENHCHAFDISVAIWRRPFYLTSCYTKVRRDVSQTPFFVTNDDGKRQRLGVTSVEEQILPPIVKACQGISIRNNSIHNQDGRGPLFGMAKFHASGREDMDVRMILPTQKQISQKGNGVPKNISARPFVCEIIDALKMPLPTDLKQIVAEINHETTEPGSGETDSMVTFSYGRNPMGVGISPQLDFVSSAAFANLQLQTEHKIKHYGCLCWTESELPISNDDETLNSHLFGKIQFPLQLQQRTPLRVLHRRPNLIRLRHVITCRATLIDKHHFRLHLSTDAGTYVKEFVHGDLGRTVPSICSLLGCRTDILELDCEGIQMDENDKIAN